MQTRLAFAAEFWGDAAVVCLAVENRAGLVVDPEFGLFDTWTHANAFAAKLNEGLELDPVEARRIITSSMLSSTLLLRPFVSPELAASDAPVLPAANALQGKLVLAELDHALTFCRIARTANPSRLTDGLVCSARNTLYAAMNSLGGLNLRPRQLGQITARVEMLAAALWDDPPGKLRPYGNSSPALKG
jgi:hypothetical protein